MNNNTWIISDTHFFHKNIIKYENRPFSSIEEMNETIITNWNSVVNKDDKIFHLGDVVFSNKDTTKELLSKLNGHKILILGNHDYQHTTKWWREVGFDDASRYPIIYKDFYILSHFPLYMNEHMPYVNIHGHIHSKGYKQENLYYNVSCEVINYTPINFEVIKSKFVKEE